MTETPNQQQTPQCPPPPYDYPMSQTADDEIDLRELFTVIWQGKWWIMAITFLFAVGAVVVSLLLPNIYKSQVLLAPAESSQSNQMAGLASQFGGLASLAGINLGANSSDKATLALQVLQSQKFIGEFIAKHKLLIPIMAATGWNSSDDTLKINADSYDVTHKRWVRKVDFPFKSKPSLQEAYKRFKKKILEVDQDKKTGMVTVSVSFYSPYLAQQWVTWLIIDLNEEMSQQDMTDAQNSIHYLNAELAKTSLAENRTMLYQLIEQQTKTLMLTKVRKEYAFKTVDPAVAPELKNKPKRALICALGTLLGLVLAVMVVLIRHFTRKPQ